MCYGVEQAKLRVVEVHRDLLDVPVMVVVDCRGYLEQTCHASVSCSLLLSAAFACS